MQRSKQRAVDVVIVGGGFGGRYAAQQLAKRLPIGSKITMVDRNDYLLYTPMLTEVAGRSVSPGSIGAPNAELSKRITLLRDEVSGVDLRGRTITLASGRTLAADHLVLALGSTTNFHDVEGAEQHSLTMKSLEDAQRMRALAERRVERAARESDVEERRRLLSFVVAGGGYTGVETIAALNELVRDTARRAGVAADEIALTLVEAAERLMSEMPESLASYSRRCLEKDGIRVQTGVGVGKVSEDHVVLTNGETIAVGMLIWNSGIQPNALIAGMDCEKGKKGGVRTDSTFKVLDRPGVWAIGDCAEVPKADGSGEFFEPTAQNATRQGTHVANNILAVLHGRAVKPFRFTQVGALAVVSPRRGVAHVYGVRIRGIAGWLLWRGIYLAKMPSMRQRLRILGDWIRLVFGHRYVSVESSRKSVADGVRTGAQLKQFHGEAEGDETIVPVKTTV